MSFCVNTTASSRWLRPRRVRPQPRRRRAARPLRALASMLRRGVYFVDDRPFTDAARIRAAVWSYGARRRRRAALAAAWWHGPDAVRARRRRGDSATEQPWPIATTAARVRRRDLKPADIVELRGLRVTDVALSPSSKRPSDAAVAPSFMDAALQRHTDLPQLVARAPAQQGPARLATARGAVASRRAMVRALRPNDC